MYKKKVIRWYQETIEKLDINTELKKSLSAHERVPTFIQNLSEEFVKVQQYRLRKGKRHVDVKYLREITIDMVKDFVQKVEKLAEERVLSDLAKRAELDKASDAKDMEETLDGKPAGAFEDMGLEMPEDRKDESYESPLCACRNDGSGSACRKSQEP